MKNLAAVILFSIFGATCFPAAVSQSEIAQSVPKIVFQTLYYDFGLHPVNQHAVLKHNIPFTNKGNGSLMIFNVKSNCDMVRFSCSSYRLEPGETAELQLIFEIAEKYAVQGELSRTVTLTTNDPEHRSVVVNVVAGFGNSLYCRPAKIDFGSVAKDKDKTTSFALFSNTPGKFSITKYVYDKKLISYSVLKDASATEVDSNTTATKPKYPHIVFAIKLNKGTPAGQIADTFQINTNRKDISILEIPIVGQVVNDIEIVPKDIFMGILKIGATFSGKISIASADPNFKVLSCKTDLAGCECKIDDRPGTHTVTIEFKPLDKKQCNQNGSVEKSLTITTNSAQMPSIKVKVYGMII